MKTQGFTLIEMMIVIAIVAILAAVAIPMYQTYIVRAKITEALNAASSTKTYVSIHHAESGQLPNTSAELGLTEDVDWDYVEKIEIQAQGRIVVTVRGSAMNQADTATFELVPAVNGGALTWSCRPPGTIAHKYLPAVCRPST